MSPLALANLPDNNNRKSISAPCVSVDLSFLLGNRVGSLELRDVTALEKAKTTDGYHGASLVNKGLLHLQIVHEEVNTLKKRRSERLVVVLFFIVCMDNNF